MNFFKNATIFVLSGLLWTSTTVPHPAHRAKRHRKHPLRHKPQRQQIKPTIKCTDKCEAASKVPTVTNNVLLSKTGLTANDLAQFRRRIAKATCQMKQKIAQEGANRSLYYSPNNDINSVPDFVAVSSKGMPHNALGIVEPSAVLARLKVVAGKDINQMVNMQHSNTLLDLPYLKFPQFDTFNTMYIRNLYMPNPASYNIPPNPEFLSDETAAEMIELYGASLCRDVKFTDFSIDPTIAQVVAYLNVAGPAYKGPKINGLVTPDTIFRYELSMGRQSLLPGPYISQLSYLPINGIGDFPQDSANAIEAKMKFVAPGCESNAFWRSTGNPTDSLDYFVKSEAVIGQTGAINGAAYPPASYETTPRYIQTFRDMATWRQIVGPETFLRILGAILSQLSPDGVSNFLTTYALNPLNPLKTGVIPFTDVYSQTFSVQDFWAWISESFQQCQLVELVAKNVFLRARPEQIGIEVQRTKTLRGLTKTYYHNKLLLSSGVLDDVFELAKNTTGTGNYFLSQYYNIGSPLSPSYPSGYVLTAAAGVTILKAILDPNYKLSVFLPDSSGQKLIRTRKTVKLGDELDKWAYNAAADRISKGFHYRSDVMASLKWGEQIAIDYLKIKAQTYVGAFPKTTKPIGWRVRKFDGFVIDILVPKR